MRSNVFGANWCAKAIPIRSIAGFPAEAVKLAEKRLIWLNEAFDSIEAEKDWQKRD